jgi:Rod binding domain-containing protein
MSVIAPGSLPATGGPPFSVPSGGQRLSSAAKEFESVLLGQWLKDAESTFGSVPGNEEEDASGEQMKEFAMQHVAGEITNRGGIGIAPIVEMALAKQEKARPVRSEGEGR